MTSLAPHIEAFLREHLASPSWRQCNTPAIRTPTASSRCSSSLPRKLKVGAIGSDAGAVGCASGQRISRASGDTRAAIRRKRETSAWLPSGPSSAFCSTASPPHSHRSAAILAIPFKKTDTRLVALSGPGGSPGFAGCARSGDSGRHSRSRHVASCDLRRASSLGIDRPADRRCRPTVREHPRAGQRPS